ncbi:winged helix-turn-helix domain-containing protein [Roseobacter sp. S98]|uniref:winged helix-turn-helix domain-containing protein n=1 Tax=Roseobacter algicola (ex Choi et al. 2025) (nom. illeg.) TaxID=3092138 RepID=UPI0035C7337F
MIFEFDGFRLDTERVELRGPDGPVPLEPKSFALLKLLVGERHRAVSKEEIFEKVWPGVFVTDASLSTAIRQIRRALKDDGDLQKVIRTVRGHGFRFVAETRETGAALPKSSDHAVATQPQGDSGRPTIAIRPFRLLGGSSEYQAIAEAIPAELIATLSRLRWLKVIARASSFQFAQADPDLAGMGETLGARFVVSGIVEHLGRTIIIAVDVSDTRSGEVIWSNRLTGTIDTVFTMREEIARDLATMMELRLPQHAASMQAHVPSDNLDAWDHYHLAVRHMYRYNKRDNDIAAGHFQRALTLDPSFARASSGLSYTEFQNAFQHFGSDGNDHRALALSHAEQAMTLDPLDPF